MREDCAKGDAMRLYLSAQVGKRRETGDTVGLTGRQAVDDI